MTDSGVSPLGSQRTETASFSTFFEASNGLGRGGSRVMSIRLSPRRVCILFFVAHEQHVPVVFEE